VVFNSSIDYLKIKNGQDQWAYHIHILLYVALVVNLLEFEIFENVILA